MNHRVMFRLSMVFLAVCLAITTSLPTLLFTLFIMGMLPGTQLTVPAWVVLTVYPLIMLLAIRWLSRQPLFSGNARRDDATARTLARKRVASKTSQKTRRVAEARRRYRAVT